MRVGLVADTHGLLDPSLPEIFRGVELVLHAGDVGKPSVLDALREIAPLRAVRGNVDLAPPLDGLPELAVVPLGELVALLVHDLGPRGRPGAAVRAALARERPGLVVHGHSHRPGASVRDGLLLVNPGSAGPRRFSLPRTVALLSVRGRRVSIAFHDLSLGPAAPPGAPFEATL
jgi:putative phosphoesterase